MKKLAARDFEDMLQVSAPLLLPPDLVFNVQISLVLDPGPRRDPAEQSQQDCRKKPKGITISSDYYYVWMIKNVILIAFLLAGRNSYQLDEILIGPQDFYFPCVILNSRARFLPLGQFPAHIFYFLHGLLISHTWFSFSTQGFYFPPAVFIFRV